MPGFVSQTFDEDPETFHQRRFDHVEQRSLWVPTLSADRVLVLGSSQDDSTLDHEAIDAAGLSVARRRTGGGAVLVGSAELVWFDVILPHVDPLWVDDVTRSFDWLGSAVQEALVQLGIETERHVGPLVRTTWSDRVCFAGVGPGELLLASQKVVGMSQRRSKSAARFQVAILRRWDGPAHRQLFVVPEAMHGDADRELSRAAVGIPHAPDDIMTALIESLDRA